ncbi:hypothetical protein EYF80_058257 [Liparis tanakae]|uniref:Secreted protein n=1 Tax=Liparis tanakae TaxID=230148 RepID=A0A4Z2ESI2_9TELE|nr:hypothetical protein EYF80_058257 [Liparis tanakae]
MRMRCLAALGVLLFLMTYTPSSSSCTSSSSRWPRALMLPRGFTTWPSRSSNTSGRRLVLDLNTTSPRFSGGRSMWMSSPKNAVLRSSLTGREDRGKKTGTKQHQTQHDTRNHDREDFIKLTTKTHNKKT